MFLRLFARDVRRTTILVLVLSASLELIFFIAVQVFNPDGVYSPDSRGYWAISSNLIEHSSFSQSLALPLLPDSERTPVYPFFLAGLRLLGLGAPGVVGVQLLVSVLATLIAMEVAYLLFSDVNAAAIAGVIVAIDIPTIVFSNMILTETLFSVMFLLSVLFYLQSRDSAKSGPLLLSGATQGLSVLCRPVSLFFPAVLILLMILVPPKSKPYRFRRIAVFLVPFLLVVGLWVGRNYSVFHTPFVSTISSINMLEYRAAGVVAERGHVSFSEAQRRLVEQAERSFSGSPWMDPIGYYRHEARIGAGIVMQNIPRYILIAARSTAKMFFAPLRSDIDILLRLTEIPSSLQQWGQSNSTGVVARLLSRTTPLTLFLVAFQVLALGVVWIFSTVGGVRAIGGKRWHSFLLVLATLLYYALIAGGPEAYARFRVPLVPFLAASAGFGLASAGLRLTRRVPPSPA